MHILFAPRERILDALPRHRRWAEIGVFRGEFSQTILEHCDPSELHLIDPWHFDLDFDYFAPPPSSPLFPDPRGWASSIAAWTSAPDRMHINEHFDTIAQSVAQRFANDRRVTIHRAMAHLVADTFADEYFDFVYIDGAHDYANVLRDLQCYAPKVSPSGALLGDDYCEMGTFANAEYGVVGAVTHYRRLIPPTDLIVIADLFSMFGLFPAGSPLLQDALRAAGAAGPLLELPDAIAANYHQVISPDGKGGLYWFPSFA